jgi:hypothetical protein
MHAQIIFRGAAACPHWVDAVEKGKNEPIKIFAHVSVATDFSQSNGSQRDYEGR